MMTNAERLQANNAELLECIEAAKSLPDAGGGASTPLYEGPCEVIPSRQDQMLSTAGKYLAENIWIRKIPENYGLISYNQDRVIKIT